MNRIIILIALVIPACIGILSSCTGSERKYHYITAVSYDTLSAKDFECPLIRLYFTTGFDNNSVMVNWNNSIIYNGIITTNKINGIALKSVTIPKNPCNLIVTVDEISIEKEVRTDYCNLLFRKSGDSLFLEFTDREIKDD